MNLVNIVLILLLAIVIIGGGLIFFFILRDTFRGRGRWGVNLKSVKCPGCGEPASQIRTPTSLRQATWGGWTCTNCGCEMNKWGEELRSGKLKI